MAQEQRVTTILPASLSKPTNSYNNMSLNSQWSHIVSSSTIHEAIRKASKYSKRDLKSLPVKLEILNDRDRDYIRAVTRALCINTEETGYGWELWEPTDSDKRLTEKRNDSNDNRRKRKQTSQDDNSTGTISAKNTRRKAVKPDIPSSSRVKAPSEKGSNRGSPQNTAEPAPSSNHETILKKSPTPEELKAANAIKQWALVSPHSDPPYAFIKVISESVSAPGLLQQIVPRDATPGLRAAVISAFGKDASIFLVKNIVRILMSPYLTKLTTPAPRDIMQAMVDFSEIHWRGAVLLFEDVAKRNDPIPGSIAEVLVRITSVLTTEGALTSLHSICNCTWGEDGVRVVEALVGKCAEKEGLASFLVPALDKNIAGCEKSVRFGKLLFTIVKQVPEVSSSYSDVMESVVTRSQVFLAKRAISLLKAKK